MELLQESIMNTRDLKQLRIATEPHKGSKTKKSEDDMMRGRKMNK